MKIFLIPSWVLKNTGHNDSGKIQAKSSNLVPSENVPASDRAGYRGARKQGPVFSKLLGFVKAILQGKIKKLNQSLSRGLWSGRLRGTQWACKGSSIICPEGIILQTETQVEKIAI